MARPLGQVDKITLDTVVLATPKARVIQAIGRAQRPCPTKQCPLVLDVADEGIFFQALRWKRQNMYSQERYAVQIVRSTAPEGCWWM